MLLVTGSYTANTDPGIYLFESNQGMDGFDLLKVVVGIENPSYLTVSADGKILLAISESKTGDLGQISSYLLEGDNITLNGGINYTGGGSCFISVDNNFKHAFIANYGSGTLSVINLVNGVPKSVAQTIEFTGYGPNPERQEQPHIHAAMLTPDQRYLYCTDLGTDRIYKFSYNPTNDIPLTACDPQYIHLPPGSGPRHFTFNKDGRWIYVLCELSGEIFKISNIENQQAWIERKSVVASDYKGKIEAADIRLHPTGKFLYASHRGETNEIVVFRINQRNGRLTFTQRVSAEGLSPRNLFISDDGKTLLSANEQSNNITVFKVKANGTLKYAGYDIKLNKPAFVQLIQQ